MAEGTLSIGSWSGNQIHVDPGTISANSGLEYPRLIIPVRLELNPIKENNLSVRNFIILNTTAELFSEDNQSKISDSISGSYPYKVFAERLNTTYRLEFPLDYKRVSKIEEHRRDNLSLQLNLHFTIGIYEQNFIGSFENCFVRLGFEIEQSYWIKNILPALEFGKYFIVEIPKGNKLIEGAWSYIEKADNCYKMWDTKGAFANCREAGTLLDKTLKEKLSGSPNMKKWKRTVEKFKYLSSLDLHIEEIRNEEPKGFININKNDTEHLIIITKALLKYAEELLIENNYSFISK